MSTYDRIDEHWRRECKRFPQLREQITDKTGVHFSPRYFCGVPLPELPSCPPFPLSWEVYLGKHYKVWPSGVRVGPRSLFENAGFDPHGQRFIYGEYVIGSGLYSLDEDKHRKLNKKYAKPWLAALDGKIVAGTRLGWVWTHPHHRRRGLSLELAAIAWRLTPFPAFYVRRSWWQHFTRAGFEHEKKLYAALVERGIVTPP